jgi:arylsulfatase A-like enzyme
LHESTWIADRSIAFLQTRDRSRPFFLMSSFLKPHPPFESPTPWNRLYRARNMEGPFSPDDPAAFFPFWNTYQNRYKYRGRGRDEMLLRSLRAAYYGCISFVDFHIRRILDALGPEQDNTLIVLASDHGELLGDYGCFGKRTMQEVSARVPLIVRWPAAFAAGARFDGAVSMLDLYPTFLEAAGEKESPSPLGMSLLGARSTPGRRTVISQFESREKAQYLASDGAWKYAYSAPDRKEVLVDLTNDPQETRNLAEDPAQRGRMELLRGVLRDAFARDSYPDAFDGDAWKAYPQPQLRADPDDDLIEQEPASVALRLADLGADYATASRPLPKAIEGL